MIELLRTNDPVLISFVAAAAASPVGSMKVEPLASCAEMAATEAAGACPHMAPVSPRQRST